MTRALRSPRSFFPAAVLTSVASILTAMVLLVGAGCSRSPMPAASDAESEKTAGPRGSEVIRISQNARELQAHTGVTGSLGGNFSPEAFAAGPVVSNIPAAATGSGINRDAGSPVADTVGEELWVIERTAERPNLNDERAPRSGSLLAKTAPDTPPDQMQPCPLKHTDVKASVAGYVASVEVVQQFLNPFNEKIEAVYVFPLPENAAINEFVMTIGDRTIRGIIREREQAKQIYEAARSQGRVASLLTQERPNVFTQSVANIEPGKAIDVRLRYFNTLHYMDGWYEFAFPMVVGPRFNPPSSASWGLADGAVASGGIGAVGPGARGASGQPAEVSYLPPGSRSGHDIAMHLDLSPGVLPTQFRSVNHAVTLQVDGAKDGLLLPADQAAVTPAGSYREDPNHQRYAIDLSPADSIPNKDFVFRWQVGGTAVSTAAWVAPAPASLTPAGATTSADQFVSLMVVPPQAMERLPSRPLEFIFALDVSGSMEGRPIEQARAAMLCALGRLNAGDRFQVVTFASTARPMAPAPVPVTPANIAKATQFIQDVQAGGGTMMLDGIQRCLAEPVDPRRTRVVCLLTDGFIGNEQEILASLRRSVGNARVFSFGVGSGPNRYLMDAVARLGHGACAYVGLTEKTEPAMDAFFDRVRHPAMTDVTVEWGADGVLNASTGVVEPSAVPAAATPAPTAERLPDLWVGRPIVVNARRHGGFPKSLKIRGQLGERWLSIDVPVQAAPPAVAAALPSLWARGRIASLADQTICNATADSKAARQLALQYGLLSSFTSFIAVDSFTRTAGDHGVTVPVLVPLTDGVRYDTSITENRPAGN